MDPAVLQALSVLCRMKHILLCKLQCLYYIPAACIEDFSVGGLLCVFNIVYFNFAAMTIPDQLQNDMDSLEEQFKVLVDSTFKIIKDNQVDMSTFKLRLFNLSVRNKILHQEFLKIVLSKISSNSTFEDIWFICSLYWTFMNYSLLEHLVEVFGNVALKSDFRDYKDRLRDFRRKTCIRDFTEYLGAINETLSKEYLKTLVTKLHKRWDRCTLEDLERSRENIARKFFLPTYFFNFMDATPGSISITWAVPAIIIVSLKENMDRADIVEFCVSQGILSMRVENREYEYVKSADIYNSVSANYEPTEDPLAAGKALQILLAMWPSYYKLLY